MKSKFYFSLLLVFCVFSSLGLRAQIISTIAGIGQGNGYPATAVLIQPSSVGVDDIGNIYIADNLNSCIRKVSTSGIINTIYNSGISGMTVDSSGNVYFSDGYSRIFKITTSGAIITVAGIAPYSGCTGCTGYSGDGGPATAAELWQPREVAVDANGNVYFGDQFGSIIRKVNTGGIINTIAGGGSGYSNGSAATAVELCSSPAIFVDDTGNVFIAGCGSIQKINTLGIINTIAGGGTSGIGDGGPATAAEIYPNALVIDRLGNMYVADGGYIYSADAGNTIRKINTLGIITTIAGNGIPGYSGDGGSAATAEFNNPTGIAIDSFGNIYIADYNNTRIRKINTSGIINTIAGNGSGGDGGLATAAQVFSPNSVAVDHNENIYISDGGNNCIRKIDTSGIIITFAGNGTTGYGGDGGQATAAKFFALSGVATDYIGNVYVVDVGNERIRKINTSGIISTIAGNGTGGYSGDGGPATAAELAGDLLGGIAVDSIGNVFISDGSNNRIRKVDTAGIITTIAGNGTAGHTGDGGAATAGELYNPMGVAVDRSGNVYIADWNAGGFIRKVNTTGIITTIVGLGLSYGDGIVATEARVANPGNVACDASGNVYFDDAFGVVRKVNTEGLLYNFAGYLFWSGSSLIASPSGFSGDGGPAELAELNGPEGMAVDGAGNVFIADGNNDRIRKVRPVNNAIIGNTTLCAGEITILTDSAYSTLLWSSSNTAVATVGTSGIVTGVAAGTATISYNSSEGIATKIFTVNPLPNAITGTPHVCVGSETVLSDTLTGGTWSSGNIAVTTLGSGAGIFTGVSPGTATITYTSGSGCIATTSLTVNPLPSLITGSGGGIISTVAGNGSYGYGSDGVAAIATDLWKPWGVAVDGSGNVYIADGMNSRIRKVNTFGIISTIAGNGTAGYGGDGIAATATDLNGPEGVAVDGSGNIYIVDAGNNRIRMVNTSGIISTIAGNGTFAYSGDGVAATASGLGYPTGAAVDGSGNVYIADYRNNRIRKVNTSGIISTIAGNGSYGYGSDGVAATTTDLAYPSGVAVDGSGNVYIADFGNNRIRKLNISGIISTVAGNGTGGYGSDGVAATATDVNQPYGVAVDGSGNVYIADADNQRIRKVNVSGIISTIAGNGINGYGGDGVVATATNLSNPIGVAVDGSGNVYIADESNNRIRKVTLPAPGAVCAGATETLVNATPGGLWSSNAISIAAVGSLSGIVVGVSAGTANITYALDGDCTATTVVTVNPLPVAGSISGASNLCVDATITLTESTSGGVWSDSSSLASVLGGVVTAVSSGVDTIKYFVTNSCGTATAIKTIAINPLPTAGAIAGAGSVCAGAATTLTESTTGGVWSSSTTSIATIGSTGIAAGISAGSAAISYAVTNICGTAAAIQTITVNPLPIAGTITGLSSVCATATITLTDTTTGGAWSSSSLSATVGSGGVVTGVSAGLDTISYAVTNVCGTAIAIQTVTINPLPIAGAIAGVGSVCAGASITLTESATGGVWSSSNTCAMEGSAGSLSVGVTGVFVGMDTISYAVTNICGTATATKTIMVNPLPMAASITGDSGVCIGAVIILSDSATGGVWHSTTATATVAGGAVTGIAAGTAIISYAVTNVCGSAFSSKTITISAMPVAGVITGDSSVCPDSTVTLTDTAELGTWSSVNGLAVVDSAGAVTGLAEGAGAIVYSVTNICGTVEAIFPIYILPGGSCGPTGVAPISFAPAIFKVYPNPNNGSFTMLLSSAIDEQATVAITNMIGEKVKVVGIRSNVASDVVLEQAAGVYLISVDAAGGRYEEKITVVGQ